MFTTPPAAAVDAAISATVFVTVGSPSTVPLINDVPNVEAATTLAAMTVPPRGMSHEGKLHLHRGEEQHRRGAFSQRLHLC